MLISTLLLGAFTLVLPLAAERVEDVANPRRASGIFVSDGGGVLGPEYVRLIDAACRELQAKTSVELAVVTVGDLDGTVIEDYAEKLFRRFSIGAAGKDNGLL
ncbi:MAG TPA: TPM domain-containing protein, partial [Acidobacteriota bacterium]